MPKLFVSGCSYSSYTGVDYPWGECLAPMLEYDYHHIAMGAGNNDRTWRILSRMIMESEITPEDLVIVQYTDLYRTEFAASAETYQPLVHDPHRDNRPGKAVPWIHKQHTTSGDVYTTNFKPHSHTWVSDPHKELHYIYEKTALDGNWHIEHFVSQHAMFKVFCDHHDIRLIILNSSYDGIQHITEPGADVEQFYLSADTHMVCAEDILWPERSRTNRHPYDLGHECSDGVTWDNSHLSQVGHIVLAEGIFEYIKQENI